MSTNVEPPMSLSDAIQEGKLIPAGDLRTYAGPIVPIYFTRALWDSFIKLPVGAPIEYATQEKLNRVIKALDDELLVRTQNGGVGVGSPAEGEAFPFQDNFVIDNVPGSMILKGKLGVDARAASEGHRYYTIMMENEG